MKNCPQCGRELGADAVRDLCPECLLKAGFGTVSDEAGNGRGFVPPPVADLAPLFPKLEILELVGRGGMGAVYKARQKELDRVVALKILPPDIGRDPAFAERFAREARALARLGHANVVTLYEFGRAGAGGPYYFLMEFVDGVNLRQLLDGGRVSPREALAIVPQICDALQYAHDHGIVHRDIKPENILLDRQGRVKVADFGLAKLVRPAADRTDLADPSDPSDPASAVSRAGRIMGTPRYMAPEQREHPSDVDHRADIYSLGVVFYQMLTGELPKGDLEPPSKKVTIDVRLDEVVLRALEAKPERRYQRVGDVKAICETIASTPPREDAPILAPPPPRGVALVGWIGGAAAALLYGALLALLIRTAPDLPDRVASHFGFEGAADGWMSRSFYLAFTAACPLLLGLLFAGLSSLIRVLPVRFVNLPNRDYWLAPERRATTAAMLRVRFVWLACLFIAFFGGLHALTVAANRVVPPRLPMGGLLVVVMAFLIGLMLWVVLLLMRFAETRAPAVRPPRPAPDPFVAARAQGSLGPVWLVAAVHAVVLLLLAGLLTFVGPKSEAMLLLLGASLPWATQAVLEFSRLLRHGGFMLLPLVVVVAGAASWVLGWLADRLGGRKLLAVWAVLGLLGLAVLGTGLARVVMLPITNLVAETSAAAPSSGFGPVRLPMRGLALVVLAFLIGLVLWGILRFSRNRPRHASAALPRVGNGVAGAFQGSETSAKSGGARFVLRFGLHGARDRWRRIAKQILLAVAIAMALRTWVVRAFTIRNDALSPETPAGSLVIAWVPARDFRPGDLVVYRSGESYFAGRVSKSTEEGVQVNRNGVPDFAVARDAIRGRIVTVLWRGSGARPQVSVGGGRAVVRGDGAPGLRLVFRVGGREVWHCGFVNNAPFTAILQVSRGGDRLDVQASDDRGVSLLTLIRSTVGAVPGRLAIREGEVRAVPSAPAVVGEFTPDGGAPEPVTLHVEAPNHRLRILGREDCRGERWREARRVGL